MFRVFIIRVLIKATRSRLHTNCGVPPPTYPGDQLESLNSEFMVKAVEDGKSRIEEVIFISPELFDSLSITVTAFHTLCINAINTVIGDVQCWCDISSRF